MIKPFETPAADENWIKANCEVCRLKLNCHSYFELDKYFTEGQLNYESAEYIGYSIKYGAVAMCEGKTTNSQQFYVIRFFLILSW